MVTLEVSKEDKFNSDKELHPENIETILTIDSVLKFPNIIDVKDSQPKNISSKSTIEEELNCERSTSFKFNRSAKIP